MSLLSLCRKTALILLLAGVAPPTLHAQGERADKEPKLNVRFVALGHRRTAVFETSKEDKIVKIRTPDGKTIEEVIPAGMPVEVLGKPFEYLPSLLYVKEPGHKDGYVMSPLALNASIPGIEIKRRARVDALLRQQSPTSDGEATLSKYVSAAVGEKQTHMLLALVKRFNQKEGWKSPVVEALDISPQVLPGGSLLLFNATPFKVEIDVMVEQKHEILTIAPMKSRSVKATVDSSGRTTVRANLVSNRGDKMQFYYNSVRLSDDGRSYLFAYYDPREETANSAGMVHFSDELPKPPSTDPKG